MPRDTSNTSTKARNSKHSAATGLKTGNLKTKGTDYLTTRTQHEGYVELIAIDC